MAGIIPIAFSMPTMFTHEQVIPQSRKSWKGEISNVTHNPWFWVIFSGYLLRIVFMPLTGQHDVMFMPWQAHFMIVERNWNVYALLHRLFGDIVMNRPGVWAPYPFGFYSLTAVWEWVLNGLHLINIAGWNQIWEVAQPARYVFLFKLIYLIFDLVLGWTLYKTAGVKALALWAWSSAAIYTPFLMGQNDIYPTAFTAFGLYTASLAVKSRVDSDRKGFFPGWRSILPVVFLGLGANFKFYPLILLPPLAFLLEKRWLKRIFLILAGCLIVALAAVPFLHTSTFVNGVLFNREGIQLFREVSILGIQVAPFLIGYLALCIFLFFSERQFLSEIEPWLVGLGVLVWMFLWTPTPFYWMIWLLPMLVVLGSRSRLFFGLWLVLQVAFSVQIIELHPELGIGLPVHLAQEFSMPSLVTAFKIGHQNLYRLLTFILPFVHSVFTASYLLILFALFREKNGFANRSLPGIGRSLPTILLYVPISVLIVAFGFNLLFAYNLLTPSLIKNWQEIQISKDDELSQALAVYDSPVNGIKLQLPPGSNDLARLEVCLYAGSQSDPLACQSAGQAEILDDRTLFIRFADPVPVHPGDSYTLKLQVIPQQDKAALYYDPQPGTLKLNSEMIGSTLNLAGIYSFSAANAFQQLVVRNILADPILLIFWFLTIILVFSGLAVILHGADCQEDNSLLSL